MSVQEAAHGEREIRSDTQAHRAHDRIQDVEVVVEEALGGALDDPVVVAARRGVAGFIGDEGGALLHALEDDDHALLAPEGAVVRRDEVLLADALRCRQDGDPVLLRRSLQPRAVVRRPSRQQSRRDARLAPDVAEEVDEVRRTLQARVVAAQDDAVPAGVAELDATPEKLQQSTHDPVLSAGWRSSLTPTYRRRAGSRTPRVRADRLDPQPQGASGPLSGLPG